MSNYHKRVPFHSLNEGQVEYHPILSGIRYQQNKKSFTTYNVKSRIAAAIYDNNGKWDVMICPAGARPDGSTNHSQNHSTVKADAPMLLQYLKIKGFDNRNRNLKFKNLPFSFEKFEDALACFQLYEEVVLNTPLLDLDKINFQSNPWTKRDFENTKNNRIFVNQ